MTVRANERVAWFNGEFMPESQVRIPFRDSSWLYGDGCFDLTRTFGHRLFKVREHVDRLYRSLKYLRIDPGFGPERMCALTEELFERNRHLRGADDDYWVGQRISRGVKESRATMTITARTSCSSARRCRCQPSSSRMAFASSSVTSPHPPDCSRRAPRAQLPEPDRRRPGVEHRPEAWAVLLDVNGSLRGHGLEHLRRARRRDSPARSCAARRQPAGRDRPGEPRG